MNAQDIIQHKTNANRSAISVIARNYRSNLERAGYKPPSQEYVKKKIARKIRTIFKKQKKLTCYYCGREIIHFGISHRKPFSKGGKPNFHNAVLACVYCSRRKGLRTEEEFIKVIRQV